MKKALFIYGNASCEVTKIDPIDGVELTNDWDELYNEVFYQLRNSGSFDATSIAELRELPDYRFFNCIAEIEG